MNKEPLENLKMMVWKLNGNPWFEVQESANLFHIIDNGDGEACSAAVLVGLGGWLPLP